MIQGNEIFDIQAKITPQLGGIFGVTDKQATLIAVALDAAVIFGMLVKKDDASEKELENLFIHKLNRILGDNI